MVEGVERTAERGRGPGIAERRDRLIGWQAGGIAVGLGEQRDAPSAGARERFGRRTRGRGNGADGAE